MILKAAVVFIAGGLTGSGIVALSRSNDEPRPAIADSELIGSIGAVPTFTDVPNTRMDLPRTHDQPAYIQARFAVQRPFAALHPPQR